MQLPASVMEALETELQGCYAQLCEIFGEAQVLAPGPEVRDAFATLIEPEHVERGGAVLNDQIRMAADAYVHLVRRWQVTIVRVLSPTEMGSPQRRRRHAAAYARTAEMKVVASA